MNEKDIFVKNVYMCVCVCVRMYVCVCVCMSAFYINWCSKLKCEYTCNYLFLLDMFKKCIDKPAFCGSHISIDIVQGFIQFLIMHTCFSVLWKRFLILHKNLQI